VDLEVRHVGQQGGGVLDRAAPCPFAQLLVGLPLFRLEDDPPPIQQLLRLRRGAREPALPIFLHLGLQLLEHFDPQLADALLLEHEPRLKFFGLRVRLIRRIERSLHLGGALRHDLPDRLEEQAKEHQQQDGEVEELEGQRPGVEAHLSR